jgi:RNA polymerase sigma-70 factor (ECF subfamily)
MASTSQDIEALTDDQLIARILGGQPQLFEVFVRRFNRRLFRTIRAILHSDGDVEEVMQQAYVEAYAHLDQFAGRASISTWITRIAIHAAFAHLRRTRREQPTGADAEVLHSLAPEAQAMGNQMTGENPEQVASKRELRLVLENSVDALPEHYRLVFVLRALEELSVTATAECLELNEETVRTRFFRARSLLRKHVLAQMATTQSEAFDFHLSRCERVVTKVFERLGLERSAPDTH